MPIGAEGNPISIGAVTGKIIVRGVAGDGYGIFTIGICLPDVAKITEYDFGRIGRNVRSTSKQGWILAEIGRAHV